MAIHPADIKIKIVDGFQIEIPFQFFGNMLDNRVLGFWIGIKYTGNIDDDFGFFIVVGVIFFRVRVGCLEWVLEFLHGEYS